MLGSSCASLAGVDCNLCDTLSDDCIVDRALLTIQADVSSVTNVQQQCC